VTFLPRVAGWQANVLSGRITLPRSHFRVEKRIIEGIRYGEFESWLNRRGRRCAGFNTATGRRCLVMIIDRGPAFIVEEVELRRSLGQFVLEKVPHRQTLTVIEMAQLAVQCEACSFSVSITALARR
jgi:hypothetical protein